jgi:hypothetical protein
MRVADCLEAWKWPFVMRHGVGDQLAGLFLSDLPASMPELAFSRACMFLIVCFVEIHLGTRAVSGVFFSLSLLLMRDTILLDEEVVVGKGRAENIQP